MSLRYALLALLARESLTGYDLTKRFQTTVAFFWSAKHSQIYPELAKMAAEGLVTCSLVEQASKPNKKVYAITQRGREALCEWVALPPGRRSVKDPLLLGTWTVGPVDAGLLLPHLRARLAEESEKADHFRQLEVELIKLGANDPAPANPLLGAYLALRAGILLNAASIEWVRWAVHELESVEPPQADKTVTARKSLQ